MAETTERCAICAAPQRGPSVDLGDVPAQSTALHAEAASARRAPSGHVRLAGCERCGTVYNADFDPDIVPYDGHYENSQFFSARFRAYAQDLAARLVHDHHLAGRHVIEVGSGKGEFLAELARAGVGRATGFDPSYEGEIDALGLEHVELVPEKYGPGSVVDPGAVVCRHVLEHLTDPIAFLADIRAAMAEDSPVLYVEVPNRGVTFSEAGLWDVIYQHCSYFDERSLRWVAEAAGFEVLRSGTAFDGQFLFVEATPRPAGADRTPPSGPPSSDHDAAGIEDFASLYERVVGTWRARLASWKQEGRSVALWGGGAKGVTFLNLVDATAVDEVIDVNPRKQGSYLPGTGHRVISPAELAERPVDEVVVTNAAYLDEIVAQLAALGVEAHLSVL